MRSPAEAEGPALSRVARREINRAAWRIAGGIVAPELSRDALWLLVRDEFRRRMPAWRSLGA